MITDESPSEVIAAEIGRLTRILQARAEHTACPAHLASPPEVQVIRQTVCEHFLVSFADLSSHRRPEYIANARMSFMALCRELTNHHTKAIAGWTRPGMHHTSTLHACNRIADLRATDKRLAELYNQAKADCITRIEALEMPLFEQAQSA